MNETLALYQQSGPTTFADLLTQLAPYFSTISPEFLSLERGHCEVKVRNNPAVHNHLGTVHAIAMCNAAELAAGTMVEATLPANMRWIPKGMQVSYLQKAKTDVRAVATIDPEQLNHAGDAVVTVEIFDNHNTVVCNAEITMNLKAKN